MDVSDLFETFFQEAEELLEDMERSLIELDPESPDGDQLDAIFRAAHSIKGGAGTFGFQTLQDTTHRLENLLDGARQGELSLDRATVDILLQTRDLLKNQIEAYRAQSEPDIAAAERICDMLRELAEREVPTGVSEASVKTDSSVIDAPAGPASTESRRLAVTVTGLSRIERDTLAEELALFGTISHRRDDDDKLAVTLTSTESVADITSVLCFIVDAHQVTITPDACADAVNGERALAVRISRVTADVHDQLVDEVRLFGAVTERLVEDNTLCLVLTTAEPIVDIQSVLCFMIEPDQLVIEPITENAPEAPVAPSDTLGAPEKTSETARADSASAIDIGAATKGDGKPNAAVDAGKQSREASPESTSIRVPTDKIDHIINLVGELIITQSMLDRAVQDRAVEEGHALVDGMSLLQRNARDLQEAVMSVRMVPMDFAFNRFPRLVRDLSSKLGKNVELKTVGGATELDKGLIERIMDPMTHLVRNSLDHGIEHAETRAAAGKPAAGRLTLSARHEGGHVVIEIGDDGGGLSRERILAKAKSNGLSVSDDMPDDEVWQLVFAPGFSTAAEVSDVSGRGVGMDVVKRNIHQLGGHVDLRSTLGVGTTVRIVLPLTLAIMDGMAIRAGEEVFILPLSSILESIQVDDKRVRSIGTGNRVIEVRGEYLPLIELHRAFDVANARKGLAEGIVIVVQSDSRRFALFIDELIGQQQVVVKNLETHFYKVAGISAATILGDGSVALILDAAALSKMTVPGRSNASSIAAADSTREGVES